ncbi:hypothetical protein FJZ18_01890 [Candidatus Pacearchaeota archaeon]|nr:hypothetical protein [Candidatus Pacearchaeota archaeon]
MKRNEYSILQAYQKRFGDLSWPWQYRDLAKQITYDFLHDYKEFPQQLENATHWVLIGSDKNKLKTLARYTSAALHFSGVKNARVNVAESSEEATFGKNGDDSYFISVDSYILPARGGIGKNLASICLRPLEIIFRRC